jgi:hypothetical protein
MNVTDPILRVSVVSTGQVQIRPDHLASTWRPTAWWLLASRRWTGPRPINAYVIEHRELCVRREVCRDTRPAAASGSLAVRRWRVPPGSREGLSPPP